jgi:hypothetical protein
MEYVSLENTGRLCSKRNLGPPYPVTAKRVLPGNIKNGVSSNDSLPLALIHVENICL